MEMNVTHGYGSAINSVPVIAPEATSSAAEIKQLQLQLKQMAALTEMVARMESTDHATTACQSLADQLQRFLNVEHVLVGLCRDQSIECTLAAVSGVSSLDPRGELAVAAQSALQECIARGDTVCWPPPHVNRSGGLLAHRQFAHTADVAAIVSAPLRDAAGRLRGAWMVTGDTNVVHAKSVTSFLSAAESPVASALGVVLGAQKGWLGTALFEIRRLACEKRGRAVMAAMVLLAVVLCIPMHYYGKCDCTVEPVTKRYVAAPFAGPLEKSFVKPGDVVEEGQLLARLDGRELRMELSSTRADLHKAIKERAGHLATLQSGPAEVARFEVDRLQARNDLLEYRERNVEIRSPIYGIVVSGDHENAEGMPLNVGQTLFEIAPLDTMIVELSIAEDDFAYFRTGMPVTIRLDSFPLRRLSATIESIHPRAELRDGQNCFVGEVRLERSEISLRPGMRGTAHVESDRYPLGWNLFRRPLTKLVAWLGW